LDLDSCMAPISYDLISGRELVVWRKVIKNAMSSLW
jgi:hypothetical protein